MSSLLSDAEKFAQNSDGSTGDSASQDTSAGAQAAAGDPSQSGGSGMDAKINSGQWFSLHSWVSSI